MLLVAGGCRCRVVDRPGSACSARRVWSGVVPARARGRPAFPLGQVADRDRETGRQAHQRVDHGSLGDRPQRHGVPPCGPGVVDVVSDSASTPNARTTVASADSPPTAVGQPQHLFGRGVLVGHLIREFPGDHRAVTAQWTDQGLEVLLRLAFRAVPSIGDLSRLVGVGVEPHDGEVLALLPAGAGLDGLVAAGRAGRLAHRGALAHQPVANLAVGLGHRFARLPVPSGHRSQTVVQLLTGYRRGSSCVRCGSSKR